ncbi:MAG: potassium-transporting ATPase subunit F [Acidobacteria bacterium]|nr:potassium-transporting ATPase subunit F [Acidobacteriota bacterium]
MSTEFLIALLVSVGVLAYLVMAMVMPERF